MSERDQEKQEKVTVDDVVEILAKHSTAPNDPDDADTLSRFNQQVLDERTEKEERAAGKKDDDDDDKRESPQQGSQPTGGARGRKP